MLVTLDVSKLSGWLNAFAYLNILYMFVTLDVSQLDMSALNCCRLLKRSDMSVTAETSQLAMGPYVSVAAAGLALYAWTAVCRELLSAKGGTRNPFEPVNMSVVSVTLVMSK